MGAVFDKAAAVDGDDAVAAADGREPVRDDEHRSPAADLLHALLDDALALVIERARRLVENEDARIGDERARDRQPLLLAAREAAAALADDRVVALRQLEDEVVRAGELGRGEDPLDRHAGIGKRDVFPHRAVEQHVLLQDEADLTAQPGGVDHGEIDAVDEHAAALRHEQPLNELGERALAGAGGADDADHLSGRHGEVHVVEDFWPVDAVAEGDVLEGYIAANRRQCRARGAVGGLGRRVEDVAEAQDRQPRLMEVLPDRGKAQHRRAHAAGHDVEGNELAHGQCAVDDELRANEQDGGGDELADQLHRVARDVAEAEHAEARADVARQLLLPFALDLRLDRHRFERLDAGDALDQQSLVFRAAAEFFVEPAAERRRRARRDADIEGKAADHDPGQQRGIEKHHRQEYEREEQVDDEGQCGAGQEIADVFELAHPRHGIADAPRLEISKRQCQEVAKEARPEFHVDAVGGVREEVGAQRAQDRFEERDRDKRHDQHLERAQAAVH